MSAVDLAVVLVSGVAVAALVLLVTAVQTLLRATRELRRSVERLEQEVLPLVGQLRDTVRRAGAEVDKVDDLLDVASSIQHTVEGASRLTFIAFASPLIRVIALVRGVSRGLGRALGAGGRRRRRIVHRRARDHRDRGVVVASSSERASAPAEQVSAVGRGRRIGRRNGRRDAA